MNIRQIALVANELSSVQDTLFNLLGISRGFHDPGVAEFGLHNVVMRIGDTYLEVVSPITGGTTAGRYLERRAGDSGYMVLVQVDNLDREKRRLADTPVRTTWSVELDEASAIHLHPADVPGAITSLDEMRPADSWHWGGEEGGRAIPAADNADAIVAVEIESEDPADTAQKWSVAFGREIERRDGVLLLPLDSTEVRFRGGANVGAPGLSCIDIRATDLGAIQRQAAAAGLEFSNHGVSVCGTTLRFC